ncbi:MAG: hypothetical protein Q7S40_12180 [Opitutaceae bacterium]|nr:hypothetical protein [Opitutaceae bacterium]
MITRALAGLAAAFSLTFAAGAQPAQPATTRVTYDFSGWRGDPGGGAIVRQEPPGLRLTWPAGPGQTAEIVFNLEPNQPLLEKLALARAGQPAATLMQRVNPVTLLTIGQRDLGNPAKWVAFFDNPPLRAYQTVAATLKKQNVRVWSSGARATVRIGDVAAGTFHGAIEFTVCRNSALVRVETVVKTSEDGRAILYDAGIVGVAPDWRALAWRDVNGTLQHTKIEPARVVAPLRVSGRALAAVTKGGCVAVLPPPHQYFYPLDAADNLGFAWHGTSGNALMRGYGFGIQQPPQGDRRWVPWVNAPPDSEQRLAIFYLLSLEPAEETLAAVARFTRGDRYKPLPGYHTFTSHYHIEHSTELARAQKEQNTTGIPAELAQPGFVRTFKARGVDIVHLGEFHFGATPRLPAAERLPQLKRLHDECARLSDGELLVLPGEEPNVHLGGHWMSFFPKPVYWVLNRARDRPFEEQVPGYGTVYHVGSADDVLRVMEKENGLMWTAHARIKGSRNFPDVYWEAPFFRSERFLGAAWKAMPADLSAPRLGSRVLDLLDDMSNAGRRKFVLAEADLFRMEPDYETYAHMNINYLRLAQVPRFGDGWQPVLDALRGGRFFASTGEVLIPGFSVAGAESGAVLGREHAAANQPLRAALEWTFPLAFAEVITGDGEKTYRQRIELSDTEAFGERQLAIPVDLTNRKWVRLEVWDVARNGAFTQPVWVD